MREEIMQTLMPRFHHKEYEMVRYFDSPAVKSPQTSKL
jgi:hypothetical protein